MMKTLPALLLFVLSFLGQNILYGQSISGFVLDENNNPLPFVNVFIKKQEGKGTTTNKEGKYFLTLDPGDYQLVFSTVGYTMKTIDVILRDKDITQNIWMESSTIELDQVIIRAKRKDPAYEIIQKVIENREKYDHRFNSYKCEVYVKAVEERNEKRGEVPKDPEEYTENTFPADEITPENTEAILKDEPQLALQESNITLHYQSPGKYKEIRTASQSAGDKSGLFIPVFDQTDFNFYRNMVSTKPVSETPVISPISSTAILSYKYSLEEILQENGRRIYKIRVIPRKSGNSTISGYIHVVDSLWNLKKVDLTLKKGGLLIYDEFTIKQEYFQAGNDTLWLLKSQQFHYLTTSRKLRYEGTTIVHYSDYQINFSFPRGFFNNEVAVTTKEAYEKDSLFWNRSRPEPLTREQQRVIYIKDSTEAAQNSKEYLDSLDAMFNKVTFGDIAIHGISFYNREQERRFGFSSIGTSFEPFIPGGLRLHPRAWVYKKFDNGKDIYLSVSPNYGFRNKDMKGGVTAGFMFDPFSIGFLSFGYSRAFDMVNTNDAYLNMIKRTNFYEAHKYFLTVYREIINGLMLYFSSTLTHRYSIEGYKFGSLMDKVFEDNDPIPFENYLALITEGKLSYTHRQKYIREPTRKIILGSKYPTVSIHYKKGWKGIKDSAIDFDYLGLGLKQNITLGTFGNTRYEGSIGKFVNATAMGIMDSTRFRRSDPYLFAPNGFQLLDTAIATVNLFSKLHLKHNFNGAIVNNIPLVKLLQIRTVVGGAFLWVKEYDIKFAELYGGIERIFKIGPRRRLKIGAFGVVGESNFTKPKATIKFTIDIIDTWQNSWNY